jgi:hypothetical protein
MKQGSRLPLVIIIRDKAEVPLAYKRPVSHMSLI